MKKTLSYQKIDKLNDDAWQARNIDAQKTIKLAKEALKKAKLIDYDKGIANSLHTISYGQAKISDYEQARANAQAALDIFIATGDEISRQKVLNTFGLIEGISGNLSESIIYLDKSLKLANHLNLNLERAMAFHNLAVAYIGMDDFDRSLNYYLKALKIYEGLDDKENVYKTLQNIGVIYFSLEKYHEAKDSLLQTVKLFKNSTDKNTRGLAFLNIGRSYHKLKEYGNALEYLNKSLASLEEAGDRLGLSDTFSEIGMVYMDMQEFIKATDYINKSIAIKRKLNDSAGLASAHYYLGKLSFEQGNFKNAISTFLLAIDLAKSTQAKSQLQNIYKELARVYKSVKDFEKAFQHLSRYLEIRNELFEKASFNRTQALLTRHKIAQDDKDRKITLQNKELISANNRLQSLTLELEKQAKEDSLTKLYNRRYFDNALEEEFKRSNRYNKELSVMICDIDDFKKVNDNFSHQIGDQVLIKVAEIFKKSLRESDTIARFGGEEFVALFPEAGSKQAFAICDRMRIAIENAPWYEIAPGLEVTISIGICDDSSLINSEAMISKADIALYDVKENGKNWTKIWQKQTTVSV